MKNALSCLLIVSLLAIAQTGMANMIANPDFTNGTTGWTDHTSGKALWDSTNTNGSPYGANVQLTNNTWFGLVTADYLHVEAGTTYWVSFMAKMVSNTSGTNPYLLNALGGVYTSYTAVSTEWRTYTYSFTANATGVFEYTFLNCSLRPGQPADNTVVIAIDHISVVPEPASMALLALGSLAVLRRRRK
ncbi:MAG: carbohydrate binding domain-containing protein [Lentisphaeria bacterium]